MPEQPEAARRPGDGACQAEDGCQRAVCFQVQLRASGPAPVRRQADVCADHLGGMVQQLSGWARDGGLTGGQLTIFAVDPDETERAKWTDQPDTARGQPAGFAFAEIPLNR